MYNASGRLLGRYDGLEDWEVVLFWWFFNSGK